MAEFNPNATNTVGVEWFPVTESSVTLDAVTKSVCMSLLQTAAQAIGTARVWIGAIPTRLGVYALEVYDGEDAVPANVTTLTARPNEDVVTTGWTEDDGTSSSMYAEIDEATIDTADYLKSSGFGGVTTTSNPFSYRAATGGLSLTGKRILAVRHVVWFASNAAGFVAQARPSLNLSGVIHFGVSTISTSGTDPVQASNVWTYNPQTKKPWTIADVQALDTTDELSIYGSFLFPGGEVRVFQAYVEVVICDENRLAFGNLDDSGSALTPDAWNAITLTTPTGGTWTKDGLGRHLYLLRRISAGLTKMVVPTLDSGTAPNPATGYSPSLNPTYGYVTAMGDAGSATFGLIQRTTAPAESVDSQPYEDLVAGLVYTGRTAEQEVSNHASANYKQIRALVKSNDATANLLIKVKKRSDNSQVGATITVTKTAIDAQADVGSGWRALNESMSSAAALTSGTQYYLEFSSTAAGTGSDYWTVAALDTGDQGNAATYGGTTDRATVNGSEADRYDLAVTIQSQPTAPSGFAIALATQTRAATIRGTTTLKRVDASWTPTSLSASFARYELERTEDAGATYVPVAWITVEATAAFADHESPRGVAVSYRLRVVRTDGASSDWVTA